MKNKLTALFFIAIMTLNLVFAADAYKNNVIDVKVKKESNNAVMVTIYTEKPYTEPVVVNKKANNKYVILMPETKSSLKSSPSITNAAGTVSNVTVNTQSVADSKGYTKIVITTDKAVTVVPRMQQLSTSAAATAAKKPQQDAQAKKLADEKAKKEAEAKKLAQQKAQQEAQAKKLADEKAKKAVAEKAKKEAEAKKLAQQKAQQEAQAKKLADEKAKKEVEARRLAQQKAEQEAKERLLAEQKALKQANPIQTQEVKQPLEVLEQEIETGKINENLKDKEEKIPVYKINKNHQLTIDNIETVLNNLKDIELWKLLLLLSAILSPVAAVLLILGIDKKINKKIVQSFNKNKWKREEELHTIQSSNIVEDQPFNGMPEDIEQPQQQPYSSIGEMLDKVDETTSLFHEEQLQKVQSTIDNNIPVTDTVNTPFENDFETEDFEPEIEPEIEPENIPPYESPEPIEPSEPVTASVPDVPHQNETYIPDENLSELSNLSDKEFFDELVLQSMAENNTDGLPDNSPADEIFNTLSDNNDTGNQDNSDLIREVAGATSEVIKPVDNIPIKPVNTDIADIDIPPELIDIDVPFDIPDTNISPETVTDTISSTQDDKDLIMQNEVKLNDSAGLYLVNYDNFSSLVGHIDDDYFVIKKFNNVVNSNITLRQTEKVNETTRYLVRVGSNKMVVEVSPTSMSKLIDL